MNSVESILHNFVLLFWYIGERNWTVQSTSTIVKPRKEADEYQPGDIVIAKFQGKPYKAVIVRIEDNKEALVDDRVRFDKLLHDASLSPSQILEQMGIVADLEEKNEDTSIKTPNKRPEISNHNIKKSSTKRPMANQQKKNSLPKVKKMKAPETQPPKDSSADIKMEEKQKRVATLESSKLMAARLLKGTKTDKELQVSNSASVKMSTVINTPTTFPFTAPYTPPQSSFQQLSVSSSTSLPQISTQHHITSTSSQSVPYAHTNDTYLEHLPSTLPSPSTSSCLPHFSTSQTQETSTGTLAPLQQQNMLSSIHSQSQVALPADNFYQQSGSLYDWDYSGSASELIANSFTNEDTRGLTQSLDCSRCMPLIHTLTQRINILEGKVEAIIAANKHLNKHSAPAKSNTAPSLYTASAISDSVPPASLLNSQSATPNQSFSSSVDQTTEDQPTCTDNGTDSNKGLMSVELLPGYGVEITVPQLDACIRKSKGSGTALARLLLNVYFDDKTLAASSVRGSKNKPPLDTTITNAIINYVCSKRNCAERDVVQAINQKCADARVTLAQSCKKTNS